MEPVIRSNRASARPERSPIWVYISLTVTKRPSAPPSTSRRSSPSVVVLIGAGLPGIQPLRMWQEIHQLADKPIIALVLAHRHWDHTLGAWPVSRRDARIIARERAIEDLVRHTAPRFARLRARGRPFAEAFKDVTCEPTPGCSWRRNHRR
jgi:glyoxylase-like metal-dependent hydrolase (beta-lactamase superfamily II)